MNFSLTYLGRRHKNTAVFATLTANTVNGMVTIPVRPNGHLRPCHNRQTCTFDSVVLTPKAA
jgi:hypothetical protein